MEQDTHIATAIDAVLHGFTQTCVSSNFPKEDVKKWIFRLYSLPLLSKLREAIARTAMTNSIPAAAQQFDMQEEFIMETVREFVVELERDRDSVLFPYHTFEAATQTCRNVTESDSVEESKQVQAGESVIDVLLKPPPPAPKTLKKKRVNTKSKIKLVREFCKATNQSEFLKTCATPLHQLLRWKEKIRRVLFQDEHASHMSTVKMPFQDNFLRKADKMIYKWYMKKKQRLKNVTDAIKEKAARIAKIDDLKPVVSVNWINSFMRTHQIRQKEKQIEIIDCDQEW